ncbi:hypothetical protein [Halostreptopolyspora alba]|uniref:Uncharacterized protein n=1 Tax=Halostreptopolyspora alba TaxID=2487137 RepID=A0A3N0E1W8_9ACTN|nr:hypothetical protein EFW17_21380 [Nocardiopsaceae bacterium YIM 96095]
MLSDKASPERDVLARLSSEYPGWRIWRSRRGDRPAGWVATNLDPSSDRAPTLYADTPGDLEAQLADPPPRWAAPFTTAGAP